MARSFAIVALIVSAFCFSSVLAGPLDAITNRGAHIYDPNMISITQGNKDDLFVVNGQIICDPCAFQMQTRMSKPLEGVKVTLECTKGEKNVTFKKESTTDKDGFYNIVCKGDHEEEVCMVKPENKKGTCTGFMENKPDMIVPTKNVGRDSSVRILNPLIFREKDIDPECEKLEKELGFDKLDEA